MVKLNDDLEKKLSPKPLSMTDEQRRNLEIEYEDNGIETDEQKLVYLRKKTGLHHSTSRNPLPGLEMIYVNKVCQDRWPKNV